MRRAGLKGSTFILLLLIMVTITSCGNTSEKGLSELDNYFNTKDDFNKFIVTMYTPSSEAEYVMSQSHIKEYVTEGLYREIQEDKGNYMGEIKAEIADIDISIIKKENSLRNNQDKLNITFKLINNNRGQMYAIEFIKGPNGKYEDYNIFRGIEEIIK